MRPPDGVALADTVTALTDDHSARVLVTGSHGGLIAARYVLRARVRAVIFNDAGIGCDEAGVAGLAWLGTRGVAAAAVSHLTARIGDAIDCLAHGRLSRVNGPAGDLGVNTGMDCRLAVRRLRMASPPVLIDSGGTVGGRTTLHCAASGTPAVVGLDSIGLVREDDRGRVLVIGSHGGLHGGDPASALPVEAFAAYFHDAGIGKEEAGTTRLPVLAARGLPAATVDYRSARIGDARSMWATGTLSRVNRPMHARGVREGMPLREAALALADAGRQFT